MTEKVSVSCPFYEKNICHKTQQAVVSLICERNFLIAKIVDK